MLKIRLTRTGKRNQPSYRIVVSETSSKRNGRYLESLGFYNPQTSPETIKINKERYDYWISCGAQPTETVRKLIV